MTAAFLVNERAPAEVVRRQRVAVAAIREAELRDALDFLTKGEAAHECDHATPCSSIYDPRQELMPYRVDEPEAVTYTGTGVGALYGQGDALLGTVLATGWSIVSSEVRA